MQKRITDPEQIKKILNSYMLEPSKQSAPFLLTIFSREHRSGGIIYEGHRPISAIQTETERIYCLSTSDSNYQRGEVLLNLSYIEYIQTLY